jgi:predicted Zn-dependent protease
MDGLLIGDDPAKGVFQGRRFIHPGWRFTLEFPNGWELFATPRVAGAVREEGEALALIGVRGRATDPEAAAKEFLRRLKEKHGLEPSDQRAMEIGDWPGYVITLTDDSADTPMHVHILWVSGNGLLFEMIGVAPEYHRAALRDAAKSLRAATREEIESIEVVRIRIAAARAGETLAELGRRTGNVWPADLTALVNGLDAGAKLPAGQPVKIAVSERLGSDPEIKTRR